VIASYGLNDKWRAETNDRDRLSAVHSTYSQALGAVHEVLSLQQPLRSSPTGFEGAETTLRQSARGLSRGSPELSSEPRGQSARETRAAALKSFFWRWPKTPMIERQTKEGVAAFERHDYREAVRLLQPVVNLGMMYYPRPSHYLDFPCKRLDSGPRVRESARRGAAVREGVPVSEPHHGAARSHRRSTAIWTTSS
jgi:hypothetical protein